MQKKNFTMLMALFLLAGAVKSTVLALDAPASQVQVDVALNRPFLLADKKQTAWLRVGLRGFEMEPAERTPVNITLVIDKSGSMGGEKIRKAREAAIMAIQRLRRDDILSVITYDSTVNVLIPATKVTDKEAVFAQIRRIEAGGSTALFAGVSKGAEEMRKFLSDHSVNRLVLLSDGLANVGPASPAELGALGSSLIKENISVTTIGLGLGYNEDLMTKLAYSSDGSHYFAEQADELANVFEQEFGRALSVVAQDVNVHIDCLPGIRPVRVLGRSADIDGQQVHVLINHLYSEHEKSVLLEVEIPTGANDQSRTVARVGVDYNNLKTKNSDRLSSELQVRFTNDPAVVEKHINAYVMADVVEQLAVEKNELAMQLRDQGRIEEARQLLIDNAEYLYFNSAQLNAPQLEGYGKMNAGQAKGLNEKDYGRTRKAMQAEQVERRQQQ